MKSYLINETGSTTGLYFGDRYVQPKKKLESWNMKPQTKKTATDFQNPSFSGNYNDNEIAFAHLMTYLTNFETWTPRQTLWAFL